MAERVAPGAFLFRLLDRPFSYIELVDPADCDAALIGNQPETPTAVQLSYQLFPEPIEKGVIRRARVRGLLLPRKDDVAVARDCYRQLLAAPPPLTT
jgi:hypothetical protein